MGYHHCLRIVYYLRHTKTRDYLVDAFHKYNPLSFEGIDRVSEKGIVKTQGQRFLAECKDEARHLDCFLCVEEC